MDDQRRSLRMVMPNMQHAKILLASNSPRRRELLSLIIPDFSIAQLHDVDETYPDSLDVKEIPGYLSRLKAEAYRDQLTDGEIIITADTIVINHGKVLGKPHSKAEAVQMLKDLRGHSHIVITGVTLMSTKGIHSFSETTEVTFCDLSDDEIDTYVCNYRPLDKAGAYGIQEWIGCVGISGIRGCFYNVMGLPLHALYQHLRNFKY